MVRALVALAGLVAAWVLTASASANVPPSLAGKPVVAVAIEGEPGITPDPNLVGIAPGTPLGRRVVREAIRRLLDTGTWTDVQVDAEEVTGGVRLIVRLTPRIVLRAVEVSGNEALDERVILDALRVGVGSEVPRARLAALSDAVARTYVAHGYLEARVAVTLRDGEEPGRKILVVAVIEGQPTRIGEVRFDGEQPLDPVPVVSVMEVGPGDVFDRRGLADGVDKAERFLRREGFLEAELGEPRVAIVGRRAAVTVPSHVGPRYRVLVRGSWPFSPSEVHQALELGKEPLGASVLAQKWRERVIDLYARYGFAGTEVRLDRFSDGAPGRAVLLVRIRPGKQLRVVALGFAGARHFSRAFLREQVFSYLDEDLPGSAIGTPVDSEVVDQLHQGEHETRRREVAAPLLTDPDETFYRPTYEEAIRHITELYQADGYLDAKVGPAQLQRIGKDRASVNIPVSEGPRTMLHAVVLRGVSTLSPRQLLTAAGLERGQPFSYLRLEEARLRMLDLYRENGYAFARIDPNVRFSRDRTRAEVEIEVLERFPVEVTGIVIEGAERTSHAFIRGLVKFEAGDIYRPSLASESQEQLSDLGIFTGVSVGLQDPELPARRKAVLVTLSERRNQYLDLSAGVSSGQGVRGGFEYGYRNLFGRAVGVALRVQLSHQLFFIDDVIRERFEELSIEERLERRISLGLVVPRPPLLGPVRTAIDLIHVRDNERDFGLDNNAVALTFTYRPARRVTTTLGGDLETNNVDLFVSEALNEYLAQTSDPRLRRLLRVPEGSSTLVAGRTSVAYDKRDNPFNPTTGYFVSTSAEIARTLTTQEPESAVVTEEFKSRFVKLSATTSGYLPVVGGVVLAGQARAGRIVHLTQDSKTYPNRAFFLGGVDTMRGYFQDEMIPQDIAEEILVDPMLDPNAVVRSGDTFLLLRSELRFPIYGQLQGGLFTDVGNLWADPSNLNPFELRPTGGAGLRLGTPVGPIAVDYGILFERRRALGEPFGTLHFSIGLF
jgi:outer membrane protein assembly factor BamA